MSSHCVCVLLTSYISGTYGTYCFVNCTKQGNFPVQHFIFTFSGYQKHCQGLQSHSATHISPYDIHLQQDDGEEAATVTVRDEGHTGAGVSFTSGTQR